MTGSPRSFLVGHHSHPGPRKSNQDTVLSVELPDGRWLVAVADGMGGLTEGEAASKTALGALFQGLSSGLDLVDAVKEANVAVLREAPDRSTGTTLVAALLSGTSADIVNVGDSRAYQHDPLGLVQVTRDHTMREEAERSGSIPMGQLMSTPWAKALARFLGDKETVDVDRFGPVDLDQGGWLLLCSDGLHGVMGERELESALAEATSPQEAAVRLVEAALERGTQDNVSAALVHRPGERPSNRGTGSQQVAWNPETFVTHPHRSRRRRRRILLAVTLSLVVIPLLIVLFVVLNRAFSTGVG